MQKKQRMVSQILAVLVACCSLLAIDASAQTYPVKPIRVIFGFGAGGAGDVAARLVAQKMSESFGQPVVVENRTGAHSALPASAALRIRSELAQNAKLARFTGLIPE